MRRAAAARYNDMFANSGVKTPVELPNRRHVYHIYAIRSTERARWIEELAKKGIQTGIHYPFPLHTLKAFDFLGYRQGQFPHSEKIAAETMSIPMIPELTAVQQEEVVSAVAALARQTELQPA
jgi:dTDP-4-amino-4,6-dideoxygalactose transaminase